MNNELKISSNFTWKEFSKLRIFLFYKSLMGKMILFILIAMIINFFSCLLIKSVEMNVSNIIKLLGPILLFGSFPILMRFTGKKSFQSNPISKGIQFIFNKEGVDRKGEGFHTFVAWHNFIKIEESRGWILFYLSKAEFYPIKKTDFTDEERKKFRAILKEVPNIKSILKTK